MKIVVFALCLSVVPLCLSEVVDAGVKERIRNKLNDASDQFVDDLFLMLQTFPKNDLVSEVGGEIVEIFTKEVVKSDENSKITVQNVKDYLHVLKEQFAQRERKQQAAIDAVKTLESTLSTKLPADRYNGLINLLQVFINPDSTSAEIENALHYYYGTKPAEAK